MDSLVKVIVDTADLLKELLFKVSGGESNIVAQDQESLWDSLSLMAQNLASFFNALTGEIAGRF